MKQGARGDKLASPAGRRRREIIPSPWPGGSSSRNGPGALSLLGATNLAGITESGSPATNTIGLLGTPVVSNGAALFQIGSGSYRFNVNF